MAKLTETTFVEHDEALPARYYDIDEISEYSNDDLKGKYRSFTRFRNAGLSLLGISAVSLVSGIAMVSTADVRTWDETQAAKDKNPDTTFSDSDDGKMIGGILLIVATIPLSSLGITFTAIGGKKRREYLYKMRMRGLQVNMSKENVGLRLIADLY